MSRPDCLIFITGATRGFGKAILHSILETSSLPTQYTLSIILTGRKKNDLDLVQKEAQDLLQKSPQSSHLHIVITVSSDLSNSKGMESFPPEIFLQKKNYAKAFLFNNAGSLWPIRRVAEFDQHVVADDIQESLQLNITSFILLTSRFISLLKTCSERMYVVNVSSLAAIQPLDSLSVYCATKAARNIFLKTLVKEYEEEMKETLLEKPCSVLRVLNYAPGPLDTDMQGEIRQNMPEASALRKQFVDMKEKKLLISALDSANKLVALLEKDDFESGVHIDYYDV